jgi:hypothetical protein
VLYDNPTFHAIRNGLVFSDYSRAKNTVIIEGEPRVEGKIQEAHFWDIYTSFQQSQEVPLDLPTQNVVLQ